MSDDKPLMSIERMRAYWREHNPRRANARRFGLEARCRIYASLSRDWPVNVVAKAFSVSRATVSYIGGCRDADWSSPRRTPQRRERYADVAAEFARLGEEEFDRVYYTRAVHERLKNARRGIDADKNSPKIYLNED